MTTVVLVHGAFHGGWCWDRVTPLLEEAGVATVAPDLPGHGDDRRPLGDLHGDAAAVRAVLDGIDDDVVLVGHSYGGAVITEAGAHPRVRHLVYLCALMLDAGETVATAAADDPEAAAIDHGSPNLGDVIVAGDDGAVRLPAEHVGPFLYGDCDADTVAWAVSNVGPQPAATFGQAPAVVAWHDRPSTYVVCARDRAVAPDLQRILARRATSSVEWDTSHSPFASRPELVAELLIGLARGRG